MQTGANIPFEIVNVSIALIIFFVGISYVIRVALTKWMPDSKEELEIVQVIESTPNDQSQEGGEI